MTAPADEPVQQIARDLDAEYVGVGRCGTLYRAPERQRCYRLIPRAELSADHRDELKRWQGLPRRPGLAPVVAAGADGDQQHLGGRWYQVVCYETRGRRSLADAFADPVPANRVDAVIVALRAVTRWWSSLGPGMMPMPADIVLTDSGTQLLPLPSWGVPSLTELMTGPERVLHLAPNLARGQAEVGRAEDLYTLAVAALRCFGTIPDAGPERLLHRAACAVAPSGERLDGRLPGWMRRVGPIRSVLDELCELTSPAAMAERRGDDDVAWLVGRLERARDAMDPVTAVRSLRDADEPQEALSLARTILVDDPHYDVLVLAAAIAYQDAGSPLEALTLLDRAVQTDPERLEAYAEQMSIIGDLWTTVLTLLSEAIDDSFARRLDTTLQTAFHHLPQAERRAHAATMAGHLIRQGKLREANSFAHQWLHGEDGLMWWRIDLMIVYGTTFLLLDRVNEAAQIAEVIRKGLRRVTVNKSMDAATIGLYGRLLAQFEEEIRRARGSGRDEHEEGENGPEGES
ncbi:tetratricopeptide repeat protein [Actinomadura decatromicini]|uniref:Tetratricopeptide repeat protein n=1 Tax=Actinomadura decatromicini TaxID=2604572 RepID=A0A5D3F7G5_9ACTN|nr:tetratricopeptide repeat protein [Actinomadura decatromicini]TYK43650.1 tetratricopeptide repeat protein [Actinomadura decatromicini]